MSQGPVGGPEGRDSSFGDLAVREGYCTNAQVQECLEIQNRLRSIGIEPKRLGEILTEKEYLSEEAAKKITVLQNQLALRAGKVVIPGYELLGKIGQGAMGVVYRARQVSMDRIVAIKVLGAKYARDGKYVARFLNEARAVAKLNHENVIAGIDVGTVSGVYFFVMEFVDGTTVARILEQHGKIDEKRCLQIALQISRALDHAYRHGILHRDIKPENIMIASEGLAKLCDLGLAKQARKDGGMTMEGVCVGTPNYIAPEQARGEQNLDIRADLYSLGATLYHMSTGRPPFSGPNPMVVMTKHVMEYPDPPRKVEPTLSEGFSNLVLRMMQKLPKDRYQTPLDVAVDVEKLLRGDFVASPPTHSGRSSNNRMAIPHTRRRIRRSSGSPMGLLFLLVAAVVIGGVLLIAAGSAQKGTKVVRSGESPVVEDRHEEKLK